MFPDNVSQWQHMQWKRKGPNTDPCGTFLWSDISLLTDKCIVIANDYPYPQIQTQFSSLICGMFYICCPKPDLKYGKLRGLIVNAV